MSGPPHLLHVFPSFEAAGAQQRTVRLMADLGGRFRHSVVALDGCTDALALVPEEIDVRLVPNAAGKRLGPLAGVRAARTLIERESPDVLLTYNWGSFDFVLAARTLGLRRHVHTEDGFNADEAQGQKRRRVLARRFGLARAHRLVVPSRNLHRIALEVWGFDEERVLYIPNGVSLEQFSPLNDRNRGERAQLRATFGIPERDLVIGAVGRLRPVKRFDRLIEAASRLAPIEGIGVHLLIVGEGTEQEVLEQQARSLAPPGGRVHFAGYRSDLPAVYRAVDVFANSSDSEQHPVSLLEAMACGLSVAATDVGDVRAVLPEIQHPHLVQMDDTADKAEALARALDPLLAEPERRQKLAQANQVRVREAYSFEAMSAAYAALYAATAKLEH